VVGFAPSLHNGKHVRLQREPLHVSNDLRQTSGAVPENVTCLNGIIGRIYTGPSAVICTVTDGESPLAAGIRDKQSTWCDELAY
jgi:hypothetical protein